MLRRADPPARPGVFARAYAALATTRLALFISRHINWKLDPWLLRVTRGRLASTLVFPTGTLETVGARSGEPRRQAVIYFHDGDDVIIAASHAGVDTNPAWYYNLRAHPDVVFGGEAMRAHEVTDDAERTRLWEVADRVFPAYATYRTRTTRLIPLIRLTRRPSRD